MYRLAIATVAFAACASCTRTEEPTVKPDAAAPATSTVVQIAGMDATAVLRPSTGSRHPKLVTPTQIPDASLIDPLASREPNWGLDPADGARDYVMRYVRATVRYGDKSGCVIASPSTESGIKRRVEVHDDPASRCFAGGGGAAKARDVFLVDPMADRLTLETSRGASPLAKWPDGSDPEGPPGQLQSIDDSKSWTGKLRDALVEAKLSPVRIQLYGRGSYPVITLAGWYAPITRFGPTAPLAELAEKLCAASSNGPIGLFAGFNRQEMLRIHCVGSGPSPQDPAGASWESFK